MVYVPNGIVRIKLKSQFGLVDFSHTRVLWKPKKNVRFYAYLELLDTFDMMQSSG